MSKEKPTAEDVLLLLASLDDGLRSVIERWEPYQRQRVRLAIAGLHWRIPGRSGGEADFSIRAVDPPVGSD